MCALKKSSTLARQQHLRQCVWRFISISGVDEVSKIARARPVAAGDGVNRR
jgi:hypothetical protein